MGGDGHGEAEIWQGYKDTSDECVQQCIEIRDTENGRINGVSYGISESRPGNCYCEVHMVSVGVSSDYQTCYLPGK